jgi:hypothetical protein
MTQVPNARLHLTDPPIVRQDTPRSSTVARPGASVRRRCVLRARRPSVVQLVDQRAGCVDGSLPGMRVWVPLAPERKQLQQSMAYPCECRT